jgi:histidinol-phosphate aminotransferase
MSLSRRQFLGASVASATAIPFALTGGIDYCEAATDMPFDLSMGFPADAIRLNFNENTLGPSPKAVAGATTAIQQSYRYALGGLLKPYISDYHGIDKDWILMGTGSTELLRLAPIAHARDGGNVVTAHETWGGMLTVAENMGLTTRRLNLLKDKGYAFDIEGMLAAVDKQTRILLVVTPNNPTGTTLSYAEMKHIADSLPDDVLFVLDQAYADYETDGRSGIDLLKEGYSNVLVTRTFSKAYALAGLRCGYGLAHPDILNEISKYGCGPGSINMAAFGAVLGSLDDPEHAARSRSYVQQTRTYYEQQFHDLDLAVVSGPPPFILVELGERAKPVYDELRRQKIFISHGNGWNLPDHLRISYGREHENQAFFAALKAIL